MSAIKADNVHPLAKSAFTTVGQSGLYDRARPSYPPDFVDDILAACPTGQKLNIVELGSGTGIFTRVLLSRPAVATIGSFTAVEPAIGMRESFNGSITSPEGGPKVQCVDGGFDNIPLADASADLVVAAQAFHWIGRERKDAQRVMTEIARVLKPSTGVLALIWNLEDRDAAAWVREIRDAYEVYENDTPQYRHGLWKVIYETAAYADLFDAKKQVIRSVTRELPTTVRGVLDRIASKSYIADLDQKEREQLLEKALGILQETSSRKWMDEKEGIFAYPYATDLVMEKRSGKTA